jgi:L-2-hydroxyglutarate oxidase LhgO
VLPPSSNAVDYDVVVVGAGIVGLACAARLASPHVRVLLLERHEGICRETSSRNSEVVHAGIYYPTGSRKALSCVRGRRMLVQRCDRLGIPAPRTGKLIVATDDGEAAELEGLLARGRANGVEGLQWVDRTGIERLEPGTTGCAAIWSPQSGIVDSHGLAASLQAEAEAGGADVLFGARVVGADRVRGAWEVGVEHGQALTRVRAQAVINAAGLGQPEVSAFVGITAYPQNPCKGVWFAVSSRHRGRVRRLVYPVGRAADGGLGVHLCLDVGGGMRLGPDIEWVEGPPFDLTVDATRRDAFWRAGRRLLPWLEPEDLTPDMAGIRAKPVPGPGMFGDFVVSQDLPGWVTLAGIESPGLTSALALAEEVRGLLEAAAS